MPVCLFCVIYWPTNAVSFYSIHTQYFNAILQILPFEKAHIGVTLHTCIHLPIYRLYIFKVVRRLPKQFGVDVVYVHTPVSRFSDRYLPINK